MDVECGSRILHQLILLHKPNGSFDYFVLSSTTAHYRKLEETLKSTLITAGDQSTCQDAESRLCNCDSQFLVTMWFIQTTVYSYKIESKMKSLKIWLGVNITERNNTCHSISAVLLLRLNLTEHPLRSHDHAVLSFGHCTTLIDLFVSMNVPGRHILFL